MAEQPKSLESKLSVPLEMVSEHDPLLAAEFPSMVGKEHLAAMRKSDPTLDWLTIYQAVLPVNKTFQRISKHFYWPGVKSAVSNFCRSCDVCQRAGKSNQTVPKAPLNPIPVIGEPFEKLLIDCIGPLPKSKHGHEYILTMMCTATHYPEAVPLRTLKAQAVLKEI